MGSHSEKAKRITSIRSTWPKNELSERLPEIWQIEDKEIREKTARTFTRACPDYFWTHPTSSSGKYHAKDERGEHGNWLHTKRVSMLSDKMAEAKVESGIITEWEHDCIKSAALLHDMMKYGWPSDGNEHTVDYHDVIGSEVARHIGGLPEEVYLPIHAHTGPVYGQGKAPETELEQLLHEADYIASRDWCTIGVLEPSKDLTETLNITGYDSDGREIE